ncbi:MAG: hypothetical protein OK439_03220 [Thaumarchaeota archaeon]|nr:hypothetical protein [Nitrososphaerota archaeon]
MNDQSFGGLEQIQLESKKYRFVADGTMPVLDIEIKPGKTDASDQVGSEKLTLELYHPMSGEIFEARFKKGRLEVDRDGSVTYFTRGEHKVNFSIFLSRNLSISLSDSGIVEIRSPSKILSVKKDISRRKRSKVNVTSDSVTIQLE